MQGRMKIAESIRNEKIIVIVRGVEKEKIGYLAEAMKNGGMKLLEVTFSADGRKNEETAEKIKYLSEYFKGEMLIGAGTVVTKEQAEIAKRAGARFIISPDTNVSVIRRTRELGMVSIPGALTPSEIRTAHTAGADFVKLFPITSLGADYVKAVRAPLSDVELLAVGGINENNMGEYLKAGISGFGIGSNIANKKMIENGEWGEITELAKKYKAALCAALYEK